MLGIWRSIRFNVFVVKVLVLFLLSTLFLLCFVLQLLFPECQQQHIYAKVLSLYSSSEYSRHLWLKGKREIDRSRGLWNGLEG